MNKKSHIIFINGITSFLGQETAKKFIKDGFTVFGFAHIGSKNIDSINRISGLNVITLDFNDNITESLNNIYSKEYYKKIIDDIRNENTTMFHFAWPNTNAFDRENDEMQKVAYDYSINVFEFAKFINIKKFIFAGSQAENTTSAYGKYKKMFANYCNDDLKKEKNNMRFIHLRIFSIYGFGEKGRLIRPFLEAIIKNESFSLGPCEKSWNFLYIDDFTDIMEKLVNVDIANGSIIDEEIYDIGNVESGILKDYILSAYKILGGKNELSFGTYKENGETQCLPDVSKLLKIINKKSFISWESGIKEYYNKVKGDIH